MSVAVVLSPPSVAVTVTEPPLLPVLVARPLLSMVTTPLGVALKVTWWSDPASDR